MSRGGRSNVWRFLGGLSLLIASGCAVAHSSVAAPESDGDGRIVYLAGHGWHVGLVIARADVSAAIWPESADLGTYRWLEVGWGDADYYMAERGTVRLALEAAFGSSSSVLHVAAFDPPVAEFFPRSTIVAVPCSPGGFDELIRFIHASYARDAAGRPIVVGPGAYGASRFYRATGRYRLFDNSNTWAAKALHAAGCPIDPAEVVTAGDALDRARDARCR